MRNIRFVSRQNHPAYIIISFPRFRLVNFNRGGFNFKFLTNIFKAAGNQHLTYKTCPVTNSFVREVKSYRRYILVSIFNLLLLNHVPLKIETGKLHLCFPFLYYSVCSTISELFGIVINSALIYTLRTINRFIWHTITCTTVNKIHWISTVLALKKGP